MSLPPDAREPPGGEAPGAPQLPTEASGDANADADVHAFLIADIRGYTSFTQEQGDEGAARLAARFAEIARATVEANSGRVVELRGDEVLAVFGSPRSAIRAAVALQQGFVDETIADPSLPLTVGIGLDAGEAIPVEGGYRGGALNVAGRLQALAHAGEILASQEIVHLARRIEGVRFTEHSQAQLKGIEHPVRVIAIRSESVDAAAAMAPFVRSAPAPPKRRAPWKLVAIVAAFVVVVAVVAVPPLVRKAGAGSEITPNSVGVLDPSSGELSSTIAMPSRPGAITAGNGSLWVTNPDTEMVTRIDEETQTVINTIGVGGAPAGIAAGEGAIWVVESGDRTVSRISPDTNETVGDPIEVGNDPVDVAVSEAAVWVTNRIDGTVSKIDPEGGQVVKTIPVGLDPSAITVGFGSVWVANAGSNDVVRIDPETDAVASPIGVGNGPATVEASAEGIWVANGLDDTVSLIDPGTGKVASTIPVGDGPSGVAFTEGAVWVSNESDGTLSRIDLGSKAVRTVPVGSIPAGLATAAGSLWVTVRGTATNHLGGTLRLVSEAMPSTLDPGVSYGSSVLVIGGDGLVGFKRVGGADGLTLVPDLAVSLPTPTNEGKTYSFKLRSGIEYSNGEVVAPADFRRAIEREFLFKSVGAGLYFRGLVGAEACRHEPDRCDLSRGIETPDDDPNTITFNLIEPDPEFLYKLATNFGFPVPASTPDEEQIRAGVPGTGPYMLEGPMTDDGLTLVRNEHFRQWSAEAQPGGNVDRIEWTFGGTPEEHVDAIVNGEADYMVELTPPDRIEGLRVRFAGQVYGHPLPQLIYLSLNTKLRPFNDPDVRRALNLVVDREKIVDLYGGPAAARLTCQVLPPNIPGYEPYCPYTVDPGPGGQWTGPDIEEAQRLVRRSGTRGTHVTFWYSPAWFGHGKAEAQYFVKLLEELHFEADLRSTAGSAPDPIDAHFDALRDPGRGIQIAPAGWGIDFPAPANFIATLVMCDLFPDPNYGHFCNKDIDKMIDHAARVSNEDPAAYGQAWAEVDRAITDQAPYVPLVNPIGVDFVSERLGNYQYNPEWGLLLAQVWVR
jgi:YVTN family beta-propeller protein